MPKVHKQKYPVPARPIEQGFAFLEMEAKIINSLGYQFLRSCPIPKWLKINIDFRYPAQTLFDSTRPISEIPALHYIKQNLSQFKDPIMIEYDVEACYPNIQLEYVMDAFKFLIEQVCENKLTNHQQFLIANLVPRVKHLFNHFYIKDIKGNIYQQILGLPMGSAAAPCPEDITLFICDLKLYYDQPNIFQIRYLDDIFILTERRLQQQTMKATIKAFKPNTLTLISDGVDIPTTDNRPPGWGVFLGFAINTHKDHTLFLKNTWTNRFCPLYSSLTTGHCISYFLMMVLRAYTFTSSQDLFDTWWKIWGTSLQQRGLPIKLTTALK